MEQSPKAKKLLHMVKNGGAVDSTFTNGQGNFFKLIFNGSDCSMDNGINIQRTRVLEPKQMGYSIHIRRWGRNYEIVDLDLLMFMVEKITKLEKEVLLKTMFQIFKDDKRKIKIIKKDSELRVTLEPLKGFLSRV